MNLEPGSFGGAPWGQSVRTVGSSGAGEWGHLVAVRSLGDLGSFGGAGRGTLWGHLVALRQRSAPLMTPDFVGHLVAIRGQLVALVVQLVALLGSIGGGEVATDALGSPWTRGSTASLHGPL